MNLSNPCPKGSRRRKSWLRAQPATSGRAAAKAPHLRGREVSGLARSESSADATHLSRRTVLAGAAALVLPSAANSQTTSPNPTKEARMPDTNSFWPNVRFVRSNIRIYDARVVDLYQRDCAQYLVGAEGAETTAKRS
jgi:hypothetical protein